MFPLSYGTIYKTPENHQPPDETDLGANILYPNLNSRDYARRPLNHTLRMHSSWECLALNEDHHVIIATNKLNGREWTGSLWGFEQLDILTPERASYKLQCNAIVTRLEFVTKNIFILAMNSGKVQVWSTRSEVRNASNPYCLFLIGEKVEHAKPISCMDVMKSNNNKAITGCKDGTLKVWDMGSADLFSIHTFRFAHSNVITGVATSRIDDSIFATCSLDKSALLWDDRLTRPAIAIYENHEARFKAITWACPNQSKGDNLIYLGDESGYLHSIDSRMPQQFIDSKQYFDRAIRKILPKGEKLAAIADTNTVKISNAAEHEIGYENSDAENFVRDCAWLSATELLTVGYEGKIRTHKLV